MYIYQLPDLPDVVLGVDCVWLLDLVDPFVNTVLQLLGGDLLSEPCSQLMSRSNFCTIALTKDHILTLCSIF